MAAEPGQKSDLSAGCARSLSLTASLSLSPLSLALPVSFLRLEIVFNFRYLTNGDTSALCGKTPGTNNMSLPCWGRASTRTDALLCLSVCPTLPLSVCVS